MNRGVAAAGSLFKPLPAKRAFEEIADQVRTLIYSGTLKPGDRLPAERELAVQFRTGRMAVREALRMLEQSGLIQIRQGSDGGAFVRDVDPGIASQSISDTIRRANVSLGDLMAVRLVLEDLIADLAIEKITAEELGEIEKSMDETENLLDDCARNGEHILDQELLAEMNVDFHILLARATKNMILEIVSESLMNALHSFFSAKEKTLEFFKWHVSQHRAILDAVRKKEVSRAKRLMKGHAAALRERFTRLDVPGHSQ